MQVRGLPILFLCCVASPAQNVFVPIEGERVAAAESIFNRASTAPAMKCSFKPTASTLTFSLQYEAAYSMEFSVASANSGSHYLDSFLRLQLDRPDAKPLYLGSRYSLPPQLGPGDAATLTAHFPLSPGDWRVEALAVDENGGVCRGNWRVQAKEPVAVSASPQLRPRHITVFVVSDPIFPAFGSAPSSDVDVLAGSFSSVLHYLPSESARVVVCNLGLERESFRSDGVQSGVLPQAVKAIQATQTGTVNTANLGTPQAGPVFLAGLIKRELQETNSSSVVIFLGAAQRPSRIPRQMIAVADTHPLMAYIQYSSPRHSGESRRSPAVQGNRQNCGAPESGGPCMAGPATPAFNPRLSLAPAVVHDAISDAVTILGGQTFAVSSPTELGRVLSHILEGAGRVSRSSTADRKSR